MLRARLNRPVPRVAVGAALRGLAHAAIDLSDGLAGDLSHILEVSRVGAEVRTNKLPMSPAFRNLSEPDARTALQLAGGDDYELCICLPPENVARLRKRLEVPLTEIGRVVKGKALSLLDARGKKLPIEPFGYRHFA